MLVVVGINGYRVSFKSNEKSTAIAIFKNRSRVTLFRISASINASNIANCLENGIASDDGKESKIITKILNIIT